MVKSATAHSTSPPKCCMLESPSISSCYFPFTMLAITTPLSGCTAESCFPDFTTLCQYSPTHSLCDCTVESLPCTPHTPPHTPCTLLSSHCSSPLWTTCHHVLQKAAIAPYKLMVHPNAPHAPPHTPT